MKKKLCKATDALRPRLCDSQVLCVGYKVNSNGRDVVFSQLDNIIQNSLRNTQSIWVNRIDMFPSPAELQLSVASA